MLQQIWAVVATVLGFAMCAVIVFFMISGRNDRRRDEEAREFFDRHGYWPDETPQP